MVYLTKMTERQSEVEGVIRLNIIKVDSQLADKVAPLVAYVRNEYRRKGVATLLFKKAEEIAGVGG